MKHLKRWAMFILIVVIVIIALLVSNTEANPLMVQTDKTEMIQYQANVQIGIDMFIDKATEVAEMNQMSLVEASELVNKQWINKDGEHYEALMYQMSDRMKIAAITAGAVVIGIGMGFLFI
jgi:hypothetical protein